MASPHVNIGVRPRHEKETEVEQESVETPNGAEETPVEEPVEEVDPDKIKEKGNAAFKAGRFQEAIDNYSRAIGMFI